MRYSSKKCGLRRDLEQPRGSMATDQRYDAKAQSPGWRFEKSARNPAELLQRNAVPSGSEGRERLARSISCESVSCRESVCLPPPLAGHGLRSASAVAARKSTSRRLARRCAKGTQIRHNLRVLRNFAVFNAVKPNPSFKPSPNSVPRRPSSAGPAAHFALAVQRAPLSVPA